MNPAEHDLLVIDAQDGSRKALDALVRLHQRELLRFAWSLCRDAALAQDAVQDAWLKIARGIRRIDDPRAFRGWIYHAVRWRVLDLLKRAERRGLDLDQVPTLVDPKAEGEQRDRGLDLGSAIEALPEAERESLRLFYLHGLSISEIAVVQEIAPGTVKSRLHRARNQLREHLEGDDG
ncbi:MAG: sigma-70 family RNA polymerase sigma factor [Gammaproteobacteria bacterium]|nr:sigma-70 family RNA polymerase sigma factor [Gammaproteobacteria bacterium]